MSIPCHRREVGLISASGSMLLRLRRLTTRQDDNMLMTPHPSLSDQHVCLIRSGQQARDFLLPSSPPSHTPLFFHRKLPSILKKYIIYTYSHWLFSIEDVTILFVYYNQYPTLKGDHFDN